MTIVQPRARGHQGYNTTVPRQPQTAREVRGLLRIAYATWGLEDYTESAQTVMSELVANAVRHACGDWIRIVIERPAQDKLLVAVADKSDRLPEVKHPGEDEVSGRGLGMVAEFADRWGVTELAGGGKRVWAEIDVKVES
ncbi:ATP-binding protein [Streptomyces sp. NPDC059639]|uniref:ATP-binding protein n=1 Tax=Streptomyces sp. NPDC059639 TaxID=3346891 RepID=UPI0036BF4351